VEEICPGQVDSKTGGGGSMEMREFITGSDGMDEEKIVARDMEHALELAKRHWRESCGGAIEDWTEDDGYSELSIFIKPVKPLHGEKRKKFTIIVGPVTDEPKCVGKRKHKWLSQPGVIGGDETSDGTEICTKCCCHCGAYQIETTHGSNPWCEGPEGGTFYEEPDSESRAWVKQQKPNPVAKRKSLQDEVINQTEDGAGPAPKRNRKQNPMNKSRGKQGG
jgi:hypothetical protein